MRFLVALALALPPFLAVTATAKEKSAAPSSSSAKSAGSGKSYAGCVDRGRARGFDQTAASSWCRANGYTQ